MRKNPAKIVWIIFACIGIAFVIIGLVVGNAMKIPEEDQVKTTAVITEINRRRDSDGDTTYDVWVEYEVKGEKYERELGSYVSSYRVGKEIEVLSERTQLYKFNKKVWWALVQDETHEWPSLRWSGINTCELIVDFLMNQYE